MKDSHFPLTGSVARGELNRRQENLLVLLLYTLLTAVLTYPALLFLRTKVPGGPEDNFHFLWELWYVAHALFDLHKSPFFDPDVFVPFGFSLLRNQDLSPGTVLLFSPLTHFCGEIFTYNFLVLVSFPLTAFGTYLLARELWWNRAAAVLAGIIVGFCPYRFAHSAGHLSIVSTEWIPFFFLYLERLISQHRMKSAVLAGVFFGLSAWATWYYFFMVAIAAAFYAAFRIDWRAPGIELRHLLKLSLISAGIALTFVLPFLIPYYVATHGAVVDYRGAGESQAFAAALADYVIPPTTHFLWGHQVGDHWRNGANGLWQSEWQLYLGAGALFLTIVGVFHRRRRVVVALIAMAVGCLLFSFGPGIYFTHPPPLSSSTNDVALSPILAPGRLLRQLPGFNNLRAWARLGFFVELSVGLLAAAGLVCLLDWIKEAFRARATTQLVMVTIVYGLVVLDVFPRPMDMSPVRPRPVDQWLSRQPGEFAFMEYPISQHAYGGPAIYSTRLSGKRIIMGNAQNPPNLAFWGDLSAFPSPFTLDLLYGWGAKYVLVDENLYRAGVSFWNIYQTWSSLESAIEASPRLKELTVLDGIHVYEIGSGTPQADGRELLGNGNFEGSDTSSLSGWEVVGKPLIDRTGKQSYDGKTACAVTAKDFLISEPALVEAGQCYRLSVRQRSKSSKLGTLRLQLNWKGEDNRDLSSSTVAFTDVPSAPQWQESSMMIRAPSGSKYATVHAGAASGKIWTDDYSLQKIADDCQPVLFVTPNPISVPTGQLGQAAISWNTYRSLEGRVTIAVDGGPEERFAEGRLGLKMFDGIKPQARYQFRLYSRPGAPAAETIEVSAVERSATIVADPNPVPRGPGLGQTRISWTTQAGPVATLWRRAEESDGEVYVSPNGGPEQLFSRGVAGSTEADWIATGSHYEFRLYTKNGGTRRLLAKVVVTR
jgi:hypothetical protein